MKSYGGEEEGGKSRKMGEAEMKKRAERDG